MAVIEVIETPSGRGGSREEKNVRNFTRSFLVTTDTPLDGPDVAMTAVAKEFGVIQAAPYQSGNDSDPGSRCKSISASPADAANDAQNWVIVANYSSSVDEEEQEENPMLRPTEISFEGQQFQKIAEKDLEGKPILTSAGEQFEQAVEMDDSRPMFVLTRNEQLPNFALWTSYINAVNSDPWMGNPPNTCKVDSIKSRKRVEGKYTYWEVTYEIQIKPDNWTKKILDQGARHVQNVGTIAGGPKIELVSFRDKDGQPILGLLNGKGENLPEGAEPVFLEYDVYKRMPFAALRLP